MENQKNEECKQLKSVASSLMAAGVVTDMEDLMKPKKQSFKPIHKPLPQRYQTLNVITGRGNGLRGSQLNTPGIGTPGVGTPGIRTPGLNSPAPELNLNNIYKEPFSGRRVKNEAFANYGSPANSIGSGANFSLSQFASAANFKVKSKFFQENQKEMAQLQISSSGNAGGGAVPGPYQQQARSTTPLSVREGAFRDGGNVSIN